jgi:hypothetical protein
MLEALTAEQEALQDVVAEEYLAILDNPGTCTREGVRPWLEAVYKMYDKPCPERIEICASPATAFALEEQLTGSTDRLLDWLGLSDAGWVAFYDFWHRAGVLTNEEAAEVLLLRDYLKQAFDSVLLDECALVIALPRVMARDDDGQLHHSTGFAVEWHDGTGLCYWHGTAVPDRLVFNPESYTADEIKSETNTEIRRALGEKLGWGKVADILGAKPLDAWTDDATGLRYELMGSDPGKWLKKQSPALQNGAQPEYVEPVHEELKTAAGARKWQAVRGATPSDCDKNPTLSYGIET